MSLMKKLCILDFDGTLCGTHDAIKTCIELTFDHYGMDRPTSVRIEEVIEMGVVMSEAMRALAVPQLSEAQAEQWAGTYRELYLEHGLKHSSLFPGVERTLAELEKLNIDMVIASNKAEASVRKAIEHFGIERYFKLLVCDPQGVAKKPSPESYEQIIAPAFPGITPNDVVMVGDTQADLGFARNIGALACWAAYGYGDKARCIAMKPDLIIDTLPELLDHLTH